MDLLKYAFYDGVAAVFTFCGYLIVGERSGAITYPCIKTVVVEEILSIEYRSGTVLGDDDKIYNWGGML